MSNRATMVIALVAAACTGAHPTGVATSTSGLTDTEDDLPLGTLAAEQEHVLDRRADGAILFGVVEAAPLDGDPERVITLRTQREGASFDPTLDGRPVLDARFVLGLVVTLGTDHVLRAHDGGNEIELDADVEGPLSVAGARVAYGRGDMPFFELARVDVGTSVVETLTDGLAPVWSPALSPDGSEVVFASSASGRPVLYRLSANGALATFPVGTRFPTSPRAPRWEGDTLTFEDESGPAVLDVRTAGGAR